MTAVAALASTFTNVIILSMLHGRELAWVCLGSCSLDVAINSTIFFFITSPSQDETNTDTSSTTLVNPLRTSVKAVPSGFGRFHSFGTKKPWPASSSGGIHVCSEVVCSARSTTLPRKPSITRWEWEKVISRNFHLGHLGYMAPHPGTRRRRESNRSIRYEPCGEPSGRPARCPVSIRS